MTTTVNATANFLQRDYKFCWASRIDALAAFCVSIAAASTLICRDFVMMHFSHSKTHLRSALVLAAALVLPLVAHAAPAACPFTPEALKAAFGVAFEAGVPQPGIGTGCQYKTRGGSARDRTDFSVGVYINSSLPEPQRKMFLAAGSKHELVPVAGDADMAVVVRHRGDVPAFPQVAYVRGGYDVMLQLSGIGHEPDEKARAARIDQFNQTLLKLSRLP